MQITPEQENGYPIEDFIQVVKVDVGLQGPLRVYWTRRIDQAVSRKKNGMNEVDVYTIDYLMRNNGLDRGQAIARQKTAIIEEMCHLALEKDHTPEIFVCVRKQVDNHLSPEEKATIDAKLMNLKRACIQEAGSVVRRL